MSSTPAVVTPISITSSSNTPLLTPSVLPSRTSPSFGIDFASTSTSATTSPVLSTTTTQTSSKLPQQSSSDSQTTMTSPTSVDTSSSALPSPSSTSSISSSTRSTTSAASDSIGRSIASTPETTITTTPPTSSSATIPPSTSTSTITSLTSKTTPLSPSSSAATPSPDPSSSSSPVGIDTPFTTVFPSTTIFITSTNGQGHVTTSAPPVVTEVITTTNNGGVVTTVTQAVVNPTLASNNSTTSDESFFADTGAVVGVFVVVGLASASIMMWILFAIRRRQRMRRIEQDTAADAAVAAAGLNRAPLDYDEDEDSFTSPNARYQFSPGMGQRSRALNPGFLVISGRRQEDLDDTTRDNPNPRSGYSEDHHTRTSQEVYVPAHRTSPLPGPEHDLNSSRDRKSSYGHTPTYSAGSFEPLLANYARHTSDHTSGPGADTPQNRSLQHLGSTSAPNEHSSDGNGSRNSLRRQNSSDSSIFRDEEDYAHYVLTVRNVPDDQSQHSL